MSMDNQDPEVIGKATYYNTKPYKRIHRKHSTAAYYRGSLGKKFLVTNLRNGAIDTVEITDCNGVRKDYIDLKEETFHKLTGNLRIGIIPVKITPLKNS
jgi:rare lipoprotein A (peptidoglycan hydrolase)